MECDEQETDSVDRANDNDPQEEEDTQWDSSNNKLPPAKEEPSLSRRERLRRRCCPHGLTLHMIPLALCFTALCLTFAGSWDCSYFEGASISFTGNYYGLWTMQDSNGNCQLWDLLFFSYNLGRPLLWARIFSMTAMLMGLALLTAMIQALQFHAMSWGVGIVFLILLIVSFSTTNNFNMWVVFWLLTYGMYVLIVRALFIHPVHRRISSRGKKIIGGVQIVCAIGCILTLVVLRSDFCTCSNLTEESLEGRDPGQPCDNVCELRAAGILMILACVLWFVTAVATCKIGVQPKELAPRGLEHLYAHYPRGSIVTRIVHAAGAVAVPRIKRGSNGSGIVSETNEVSGDISDDEKVTMEKGVADEANPQEVEGGVTVEEPTAGDEGNEKQVAKKERDCEEKETPDQRSCCSKICFDYRVTPRKRREKVLFWAFRVFLGCLVALYVFIVVVITGTRIESTNAAKSPDTSRYFIVDEVCAFNELDPSQPFETFPTKQQANEAGYLVAHCGACGQCSNAEDIETYVNTRKSVASKSKQCGMHAVFGSYGSLVGCLEGKIGFSRDCTKCWADNMKTTQEKCLFTCMTTMIRGLMGSNNVPGAGDDGWLNACLFCDERRSGPGFVTCSGVARRRLGIQSEIERNPKELCANSDVDWLAVDWDALFPNQ